jgi:hypothetical protein
MTMRGIMTASLLALALGIACAPDKAGQTAIVIPRLQPVDDSLSLEAACKIISVEALTRSGEKDTGEVSRFFRFIDAAADSLTGALGKNAATLAGKDAVVDIVYHKWKMAFDRRDDVMKTLLPHSAYAEKKGNCMAVSLMILMLAERLGCPVGGIILPGHFFCRYDDGKNRVNIEPNREGYSHSDDYYRTKYLSDATSWHTLEALKKTETIGAFYYAIGTLLLRRNAPGLAAAFLNESRRRLPSLVEAEGNHALALALCGRNDTALTILETLYRQHPAAPNLAANCGAVAMAAGRHRKAFEIYKNGLTHFPNDPKLLGGLSRAYTACQKDTTDTEKIGR